MPAAHIAEALASVDPAVRAALEEAIQRVRRGSEAQVPAPQTTGIGPGARILQRWQPVSRAGVYIPGGKAPLASSVVMNVVPAQVAGVQSIALASPPQADCDGRIHPTILAAAGLLGVTEVYAMGGAGAIGALAWGWRRSVSIRSTWSQGRGTTSSRPPSALSRASSARTRRRERPRS
ncbi:histidinol dehydrogenase [Microbacterium sp. Se5.02b]|uniref:histidinol dehydrogenase n=1 Tax=Microbacterium sp. Se5.02b TaxID=2864103 RepID=UPI0037C6D030